MTAICLNVRRRTAFDLLDDTNGPRRMPVRNGGPDSCLAVDEGLVEVTVDRIPILTEMAVAAGNINAAKTEEAHSVLTLDCVRRSRHKKQPLQTRLWHVRWPLLGIKRRSRGRVDMPGTGRGRGRIRLFSVGMFHVARRRGRVE